ncbi:hypothetical protein L226DRAFT_576332 [Lentinus tigrinus ALCF2SS1-7]|uniref:Uncharacterized protein n=1 Tax=Lentinus tigrinus ALCF2SS1-6 TaxID=1328759 RepID=A0A5C2RXL7_9APHY|nr:hypothetical protein L227DRAFT_615143 [Lentinus tigrinus ALCF2SS1-6]RPD68521.1 hypothetical protein L226DRAFT_576332 [Lentinus tigrinus ALCF2SS1-7]
MAGHLTDDSSAHPGLPLARPFQCIVAPRDYVDPCLLQRFGTHIYDFPGTSAGKYSTRSILRRGDDANMLSIHLFHVSPVPPFPCQLPVDFGAAQSPFPDERSPTMFGLYSQSRHAPLFPRNANYNPLRAYDIV